jgi:hypothetical protein
MARQRFFRSASAKFKILRRDGRSEVTIQENEKRTHPEGAEAPPISRQILCPHRFDSLLRRRNRLVDHDDLPPIRGLFAEPYLTVAHHRTHGIGTEALGLPWMSRGF